MKTFITLTTFLLTLTLSSCSTDKIEPTTTAAEDKAIQLEFFTQRDLSGEEFADHFVEIQFNIAKVTHASNAQEIVLDYTSGWIAFNDIPKELDKLTLNQVVNNVKTGLESVNVSKITRVRIGNTLQLNASNEILQDGEKQKLIQVIF